MPQPMTVTDQAQAAGVKPIITGGTQNPEDAAGHPTTFHGGGERDAADHPFLSG